MSENLPILLALQHVYWNNFLGFPARVVVPYFSRLSKFPNYLQQLELESNGKSVRKDNKYTHIHTSPFVFGETGTDAQHSFFQALHQGTRIIPIEFIGVKKPFYKGAIANKHHHILLSHLFAQMEAFHIGRDLDSIKEENKQSGKATEQKVIEQKVIEQKVIEQKVMLGKRPCSLIMLDELNAQTLGKLIALYEHKTFVEGVLWNINSFDQWGVELGKKIAKMIKSKTTQNKKISKSTQRLIDLFL